MKCKECKKILSPAEEDEILTALADGMDTVRLCEDCIDRLNADDDQ